MSTQDTGGPAFPTGTAYQGMTLRDYFASAFVSSGHTLASDVLVNTAPLVAKQAYEFADAMLKARAQ